MHQPGAVLGGHEQAGDHPVRARDIDQVERRPVGGADQFGAADPRRHLPSLAQYPGEQVLGDHHRVVQAGLARDHVGLAGVHRHRGVRHQRPRRRGPHQQVGPGQQRAGPFGHGDQREADGHRRVGDRAVHVRLAHLMIGQRGLAARAVRADPEVLDQQSLVEDGLEGPPHRLDVAGVHGPVGVLQVHPVAEPAGQLLEGIHMPEHRLAAPLVERGDAVRLDRLLAGQPELSLDGHLDREPVAVPARLARDVEALHGLEPGEQVLEHPGLDVMHAGHPVGGRRSLVEGPERTLGMRQ